MNSFDRAFDFTLRWEGGAFTNDPADPGGATRYGVSYRFLKDLPMRYADTDGDGVKTWRDVLYLDFEDARQIYHDFFWTPLLCDVLPEKIAFVMFDTAVNCGKSRSIKWLQQLVGARRDGYMGPKTIS